MLELGADREEASNMSLHLLFRVSYGTIRNAHNTVLSSFDRSLAHDYLGKQGCHTFTVLDWGPTEQFSRKLLQPQIGACTTR